MRTPVIVVAGQRDTDEIAHTLLVPGTTLVEHRFDGHVVHRRTVTGQHGGHVSADSALELMNCCVACTVRNDLLDYLRQLHRRPGVERIVVRLSPWTEPEHLCYALTRSACARDVALSAVVTAVHTPTWLPAAVGEEELDDGRTAAQVLVGQVEFADVVVLSEAHPDTLAVTRRLAPKARITVGPQRLEHALARLRPDARRGRSDNPHGSLLAGQPPLEPMGPVRLLEFAARRPFHPERLYTAVDLLLDGVVRSRGRLWLASRTDRVMWLESAGSGLRVDHAGPWLAAMTSREVAYVDPERRAMADLAWGDRHGDRHTSMTVLVCGADPEEILAGLRAALLTDDEMARPQSWRHYPDPFGDWHLDQLMTEDA